MRKYTNSQTYRNTSDTKTLMHKLHQCDWQVILSRSTISVH